MSYKDLTAPPCSAASAPRKVGSSLVTGHFIHTPHTPGKWFLPPAGPELRALQHKGSKNTKCTEKSIHLQGVKHRNVASPWGDGDDVGIQDIGSSIQSITMLS